MSLETNGSAMTYTNEQLAAIEECASLNFSTREISDFLEVNYEEFYSDWLDISLPVRTCYERGRLKTKASVRQNLVSSAKASITAAQEFAKVLERDRINEIKTELDSSIEPSKSETHALIKYNDSLDYYHELKNFIGGENDNLPIPAHLAEYWNRLNTAHDIHSKFGNRAKGRKFMVSLLLRKYPDIGRQTANRYIDESLNFFAVNMEKSQWRNVLTDDLEKAKVLAMEMNRIDWFIKAVKEQAEIQQLKLPEPDKIDIELLQEKVLLIVNDPGVLSPDLKKVSAETLIERIKSFDIDLADKIRIARDAGIEDIDYEEILGNEGKISK